MTNDPHGVNSQEQQLVQLAWHTVRNQRNPVKNHDATDYFNKIDFFVSSFAQKSETTRLKIGNESSEIAVRCNL